MNNMIEESYDEVCTECGNELLTTDMIENQLCENCDEEHY